MSQNEPKKDQQSGGGDNKGGQQQQRRPSTRKPVLDPTNLVGAAIWLSSAALTAIAIMIVSIALPPQCVGERGQITGCFKDIVTSSEGISVIIVALISQVIITLMIHRLRHTHPTFARVGNVLEAIINFIGLYWIICVQLGAPFAMGVYATISTFVRTMTVSTFIAWILLIALSVAWDMLGDAFFRAPGGTGGSTTQRR